MTVVNSYGVGINFEAAGALMDDDIREQLHADGIDTEQVFFTAYAAAHLVKFGEVWELDTANPQY